MTDVLVQKIAELEAALEARENEMLEWLLKMTRPTPAQSAPAMARNYFERLMREQQERADKEAPWQLRRESTMPYQNWRPFSPGDLVEVENGLGDKRMGLASLFDWGWVPDDPEHVITKARLVVRAVPPQLSPIDGEQPRCVPMPTIPVREPAYPVHGGHHPEDDPRNHTLGGGLSKLEWFAGHALPGIIAQPNLEGWDPSVVARWAFEIGKEMVERSELLNRESQQK